MKILYITKGEADTDLSSLMEMQKVKHEVKQVQLQGQDWDQLLDEIEGADQVISWQNTEHK